jgi:hypothetical protein
MDYWSWEGRPCPEYWTKPPASYLERVDVDPLFLPLLLLNCSRSVGSGRPFEISQLDDSASSAFSLILPMWLCAMLIPFSWGFEPFPRRTLSRFPRFSILRLDSHFLFVRLIVDYSIKSRSYIFTCTSAALLLFENLGIFIWIAVAMWNQVVMCYCCRMSSF